MHARGAVWGILEISTVEPGRRTANRKVTQRVSADTLANLSSEPVEDWW
jgi:hypothetical protein